MLDNDSSSHTHMPIDTHTHRHAYESESCYLRWISWADTAKKKAKTKKRRTSETVFKAWMC